MADDVSLIAKNHKYVTTDGKKLPSVSEIIEPLSKCVYGEIDAEVLAIAAMRGTLIHELTEQLDTQKIIECPEEVSGYLTAYADFLREHSVRWLYTEKALRLDYEYAGTIDRFGFVDDKRVLVDIKTSSKITGKNLVVYEAQLNLYRRMLEAHEERVERMVVLHLKKDGEYTLEEINIDDTLADDCLYIYKRMHERKRRSK